MFLTPIEREVIPTMTFIMEFLCDRQDYLLFRDSDPLRQFSEHESKLHISP